MADDTQTLSVELVRSLIADQFPQWAEMPITAILPGGWDNRSFRLGDTMLVRMPSAEHYVAQVHKEQSFLPILAPHLPLPIPRPIALGQPGHHYSWPFSIYDWQDGNTAELGKIDDMDRFAQDLAAFLSALYTIDASNGPEAGLHNFHRGGSLAVYDAEARTSITNLQDKINAKAATKIWDAALSSQWNEPAVWLHGDIAPGNLLVKTGKLCAVIDFGLMGIGDPSCDLVIAWTFFDLSSSKRFRNAFSFDDQTWQRARGWALWKCLITLEKQYREPCVDTADQHALLDIIISRDFG